MKKLILLIMTALLFTQCGGKKNDEPAPIPSPGAVQLLFPAENELCSTANPISATQSSLELQWTQGTATDDYMVYIKNLETGEQSSVVAVTNKLTVTLTRNMPYSWYVVSKSRATTATAQSKTFKFFNPGAGAQSYAPFPAELLEPGYGLTLPSTTTKVTLKWSGGDVDNDLAGFTVYFGTTVTPPSFKTGLAANTFTLADVPVTAGTTYYWKVVSTDAKGNISDSGVSTFKVSQ